MPALAAIALGFALGAAFAWPLRAMAGRAQSTDSRGLAIVSLFCLLVYTPVVAYFLATAPDWCFGYFIDTARLRALPQLFALAATLTSVPLGFVLAGLSRGRDRLRGVTRLTAGGLLTSSALLAPGLARLRWVATTHQYQLDFGQQSLVGSRPGLALVWMAVLLVVSALFVGRLLTQVASRGE
jgi:hypothetical protein